MSYTVFNLLSSPVWITFLFFVVLIAIPFIPGILELKKPKDALPLFIKMDYLKDPRYFERSFKNLLSKTLEKEGFEPGMRSIRLSKEEKVEIADSKAVKDGHNINHIIYTRGDFKSGKEVYLRKELYARGDVAIGEKNIVRAIACDGNIVISENTKVVRWIGTEGNIEVAENCSLGVLCSCNGELEINKKCMFKALYGKPVVTYGVQSIIEGAEIPSGAKERKKAYQIPFKTIEDVSLYSREEELIISPRSVIEKDVIAKNNLILKNGCTVSGSIKAYGNIFLGEDSRVNGNVFAEGEIIVGKNCIVTGNIFSQKIIRFAENVRVGRKDTVKSVIGKKGIDMTANNVIFGYILTEGSGRIL